MARRKKSGGRGRGGANVAPDAVVDALEAAGRPQREEELAAALELRGERQRQALTRCLDALIKEGRVLVNRRGSFLLTARTPVITGVVQGHPDGFGFVIPDDGGDDVHLSAREMQPVFDGDRVAVRVRRRDHRGRSSGELVKVLEHRTQEIVGRFHLESGIGFVVPSAARQVQDLLIPGDARGDARDGQIVVAEITRYPDEARQALGRITEILGEPTDPEMEIDIAVRSFGIPHRFSEEAIAEAETFGDEVVAKDARGRLDLRELPFVTIDGADARDFDDAVLVQRDGEGWRLWVAIADVSHYVRPGTALDAEARERGTSVYFPRRVVPMLPETLSNGLCSLNPGVDRLALVCEMRFGADGSFGGCEYHDGLIRSHARLTYEQVQAVLDGDGAARREHEALLGPLEDLHALYRIFAEQRRERGALDMDSPEPVFRFGPSGEVTAVERRYRVDAHRIIEECMIKANEMAAYMVSREGTPALYRVHDQPDEERIAELRSQAQALGHKVGGGDNPSTEHLAKLLRAVVGKPEQKLLTVMTLRSLAQAVYRAKRSGHYGLALSFYSHYTSPIRRYPDLLIHRSIRKVCGRAPGGSFPYSPNDMEGLGQHCSLTERRADEASWDVQAWLRCRYMEDRVDQSFDAVVSGITDFGLFVELQDALVEGLVHVSNMGDDYFEFDAATMTLTGSGSGRVFRLGEPIRVRCSGVRTDERKIDFVLEQAVEAPARRQRRSEGAPRRKGRRR